MGSVFQRGSVWWLKYRANDRIIRESSGSAKEGDAKTLLKLREGRPRKAGP
jgi:hypothetical protein